MLKRDSINMRKGSLDRNECEWDQSRALSENTNAVSNVPLFLAHESVRNKRLTKKLQ